MRASSLFAAALCGAVASAQVRLPFARSTHPIAAAGSNVKSRAPGDRRSIPTLDILANEWNYLVNVSVGTPPQQMSMRLTVQADASWVPDSQYCEDYGYYYDDSPSRKYHEEYNSCRYGAFNASESSSFVNPGSESFDTKFAGAYVSGDWMSDTLDIAGTQIPKLVMGFADMADPLVAVLGLGFNASYSSRSTSFGGGSSSAVPTVPERLVKDGIINSTTYSLWLDDKSAKSGNLLLGAIDKSKFDGPLIRFPTNSSSTSSSSYRSRTLDTVISSVNGTKSATDDPKPLGSSSFSEDDYFYDGKQVIVRLAPEDTFSNLPSTLAQDIWSLAGASWDDDLSYAIIPCAAAETSTGYITMQLYGTEGPILNVSIADLVVSKNMWSLSTWSWDTESSTEYCLFGIQSDHFASTGDAYSSLYNLGGAMLQQAYMVFDLANAEIAIAQTKLGSTATEDIVPFATYGAKIPESTSAKQVPSYCSDSTYSSYSECTDDDSGSGSGSSGDGDDYGNYGYDNYYYGGLSPSIAQSAKLGFGLGIGLFCLIVLCLSMWAVRRCRRIRKAEKELAEKQGDVEQGADIRVNNEDGDTVAQEDSPPQKPPAAVIREPLTTNTTQGQRNRESP